MESLGERRKYKLQSRGGGIKNIVKCISTQTLSPRMVKCDLTLNSDISSSGGKSQLGLEGVAIVTGPLGG